MTPLKLRALDALLHAVDRLDAHLLRASLALGARRRHLSPAPEPDRLYLFAGTHEEMRRYVDAWARANPTRRRARVENLADDSYHVLPPVPAVGRRETVYTLPQWRTRTSLSDREHAVEQAEARGYLVMAVDSPEQLVAFSRLVITDEVHHHTNEQLREGLSALDILRQAGRPGMPG